LDCGNRRNMPICRLHQRAARNPLARRRSLFGLSRLILLVEAKNLGSAATGPAFLTQIKVRTAAALEGLVSRAVTPDGA
jgi:hypothetical protein